MLSQVQQSGGREPADRHLEAGVRLRPRQRLLPRHGGQRPRAPAGAAAAGAAGGRDQAGAPAAEAGAGHGRRAGAGHPQH